ncbi:MAG: DUF2959 domain-containing protein [Candidatus Thiodiazotropha sp. (ex Dulcina madagascariensis)]|nr:DUF2959 domain-containing protein [Candidatus Thiodiazotropha sp. (ex Dulcina madagascariensis)]
MISSRPYPLIASLLLLTGCSSLYYDSMEKVGYHKRDILVDRVVSARDAQEQFQSALDQFASVISLEESDLKRSDDFIRDMQAAS